MGVVGGGCSYQEVSAVGVLLGEVVFVIGINEVEKQGSFGVVNYFQIKQ